MCMICDARDPVAIGGVMGGAATEIAESTTEILIEAAEFEPVSIRSTARALNLHSGFVLSLRTPHRPGRARLGQPAVC